jgi:hypothetical protein
LKVVAEVFRSTADLVEVLLRPKKLLIINTWSGPTQNGQRGLRMKAALQDVSGVIRGLSLEIRCHVEGFDRPVSVALLAEYMQRPRAMARIDISGSRHENRHPICGEWQFRDAGVTHFHDTVLHEALDIRELFGGGLDLPVARPLGDMSQDFREAMEECGKLLHIDGLSEVEEPQWQPRQLF